MTMRFSLQRSLLAVAMVCALIGTTSAEDGVHQQSRLMFDGFLEHGGDKIHVTITQVPFLTQDHRISKEHWKIDGMTPVGVDGFEVHPKSGIGDFKITWNDHEVPVPPELYRDCFSPNLKPADPARYLGDLKKPGKAIAGEGTMLRWSNASQELEIIMVSFEWASAPYSIIWHVTPYGVRSREIVLLGS